MPPKSKEKGIKAGAQKIKNTGAGESRCVEVGAPASPCSGLKTENRCSRENSVLYMTLPLHILTSRFRKAGKVGKLAPIPPLSPFWLCAFLIYSLHIFVLNSKETVVNSVDTVTHLVVLRSPSGRKSREYGRGIRKAEIMVS